VTEAEDCVRRLISLCGEDPERDGLVDTPERYVRALAELTDGYEQDPAAFLGVQFDDVTYDEMVVVNNVRFSSLCEHHLLPFIGHATVAYIPGEKVVGLSKLARVVHAYAHRLQVQERLTSDIAGAIDSVLNPIGTGVVITAQHLCMTVRGVREPEATMTTSTLYGALRDKPEARAEFLALARGNGHA
jgi:GTP cyclohydrolase IA